MNMGIVGAGFSMSLDGFIAGPDDDVQLLFAWYFSGDADHEMSSGDTDYKITSDAAEMIDEASQATGAIISGRRMFDVARAWGGKHPMNRRLRSSRRASKPPLPKPNKSPVTKTSRWAVRT
jgi:dihydrofolate reductase